MNTDSLTMTIPEVAKALGISRGLAYDLAKRDALPVPVIRLGERRLVVPRKALEKLLEGGDSWTAPCPAPGRERGDA